MNDIDRLTHDLFMAHCMVVGLLIGLLVIGALFWWYALDTERAHKARVDAERAHAEAVATAPRDAVKLVVTSWRNRCAARRVKAIGVADVQLIREADVAFERAMAAAEQWLTTQAPPSQPASVVRVADGAAAQPQESEAACG